MEIRPEQDEEKSKTGGIPPGVILFIAALIIFGTMFGFLYFENLNPDWLRTNT